MEKAMRNGKLVNIKHTQTIRHWAGTIPRVKNKEDLKVTNKKKGYVDIDYEGAQYIGQVDEDGLPSGEGKLFFPNGVQDDGPWFKG